MTALAENARELAARLLKSYSGTRMIVAVAGAPASGKSTLADEIANEINQRQTGLAAVFPMDGFHYDDAVLREMGRLPNKGAIDTFDAHGLRHTLLRLKANEDDTIAVPVFDRSLEISRAGGRLIPRETGIIVCEGNYLLMRQQPWDRLHAIFDLKILVEVPVEELRRRLRDRWFFYGLDEEGIRRKLDENDIPNGVAIMEGSIEPDLRIQN